MKRHLIALIAVVFALTACGKNKDFRLVEISGHLPKLKFSLTDDRGREVSAKDFSGQIVLLYFGFAGCSSQCPETLSRLVEINRDLGKKGELVRILFVSVDPWHDTSASLHDYIGRFKNEHITGLTGAPAKIVDLESRYRISVSIPETGQITHGNTVFIFDKKGNARLLLTPADSDKAVIDDLKKLIRS